MHNMMVWCTYALWHDDHKLTNTPITSQPSSELMLNVKMFSIVFSVPLPSCSALTSILLNWVLSMKGHSEPAELCSGPVIPSFLGGEGKRRCLIHGLAGACVNGFLNPPPPGNNSPGNNSKILDCIVLLPPSFLTLFSRHPEWSMNQWIPQTFWNKWNHWSGPFLLGSSWYFAVENLPREIICSLGSWVGKLWPEGQTWLLFCKLRVVFGIFTWLHFKWLTCYLSNILNFAS